MKITNLEKLNVIKPSIVKLSRRELQRIVSENQKEGIKIQNKPIAEKLLMQILKY